jgi:2-amino-4-hydroxy-6-hydroxymethyldihydropteridine diphosphokinase
MHTHTVYIAMGANTGDKIANCRKALATLDQSDFFSIEARSEWYVSEPVDYPFHYGDEDWFLNGALKGESRLGPDDLLALLKRIEQKAGRVFDSVRNGPRPLDLDIIFYDDFVMDSETLTIPHPRMHQRGFVLKPICDIDEKYRHPLLAKSMQYLWDHLDVNQKKLRKWRS